MLSVMNPIYIFPTNWRSIRFESENGHKLLRFWLLRRGSIDHRDIVCKRPRESFYGNPMTTIFHYMIYLDCYNPRGKGATINYLGEPVNNSGCIHFVSEPGKMNNRHEGLLLLGVF